MGDSKTKRKSKAKTGSRSKRARTKKQKIDAKMLAIALIFIMLFVSYAVIFAGQNEPQLSRNMVFWEINQEFDIYSGNVRNIEVVDLSDVNLTIRDSSSDSTNSTEVLEHGLMLETEGDFNCTFYDENSDDKLDEGDKFIVFNAAVGDKVKLYLKSTGKELAYYTF